jgi:hypothetical protein
VEPVAKYRHGVGSAVGGDALQKFRVERHGLLLWEWKMDLTQNRIRLSH